MCQFVIFALQENVYGLTSGNVSSLSRHHGRTRAQETNKKKVNDIYIYVHI